MTPDQIKAKAIELAAEVIWNRLVKSIPSIGPWAAARDEHRAGVIAEATAIVTAYERAMVRPLADAPDVPAGSSIVALGWIVDGQYWAPVGVRLGRHCVGIAYRGGRVCDPSDVPYFRLLPDAPEAGQ
jgi:hypothetical protein